MPLPTAELQAFVEEHARQADLPGAVVGVCHHGAQAFVSTGVTSIDNPLPITPDTLFVLGSVTKLFTATTVMALVQDGALDLTAPVRTYLPDLVLCDADKASTVSVLELLNHSSGLDWGFTADTGEGDDALAAYVARMNELCFVAEPGERASYSQAGYNLLGRIIEVVTGRSYEDAVSDHVLRPLGLEHSLFARDDVMTHRFSVGHNHGDDGELAVARLWRRWRGENPGGGLTASAADLLRWAQFHLGDIEGATPLSDETRLLMQQETIELRGSTLGDAIAIGWFVRTIDGVRTLGHAGSASGQFAELLIVPDHDFAVVTMNNAGPMGTAFNRDVVRFALEHYLDVVEADEAPEPFDAERAAQVIGAYENKVMTLDISADGDQLVFTCAMRPEIRTSADKELPPDYPPATMGLLPADGYLITDGGMQGLRGFFARDERGQVSGIDVAGRVFQRVVPGGA